SITDFTAWLEREKDEHSIELLLRNRTVSRTGAYTIKKHYICARNNKHDKKKAPRSSLAASNRKKSTKRTGCECALTIKTYPDTECVLGRYTSSHSHELGNANLRFTRLSESARAQIATLLRLGIEPPKVEQMFKQGLYDKSTELLSEEALRGRRYTRDSLVTMADILEVRLDRNDAESIRIWVDELRKEGAVLAFKDCTMPVPSESKISATSFCLILQVDWQRERAKEFGKAVLHIDGTHNTTQ
ncbi:hypothetical protein SCHPADRAFT_800198, partial [Schizopora paradoxa]